MTQDIEQFKRIEEIFESVIRLPPAERQDYLEQACKGDSELLEEVKSLLDEDARCEIDAPTEAIMNKIEQTVARRLMALEAGTKLGPYEILSPLGAGGMGEVYRAKDSRLDRDVAIKVLPLHLTANSEFKKRFQREAKAISSLTHPNICTLHDIGNEDGIDFLVMELLEGDTLSQRLNKGCLPLEDVLRFGIEIASALDKAHRAGIVHRDLKPGNIMLTKSGAKLLDFGLAKAAPGQSGLSTAPDAVTTNEQLTGEGTIVGTFQYMAPEQLEGEQADVRTDIFAFGAVLYEMVTGKLAFSGKSRASLITSIMSASPEPISQVQPMSPPALDHVIRMCLAKDPDDRIQTTHDIKLQLQWISEGGSQFGAPAPIVAKRKTRDRFLSLASAFFFIATIALVLILSGRWRVAGPDVTRPIRANIEISPDVPLAVYPGGQFAFSPDGSLLAYVAGSGQDQQLFLRRMDQLQSSALSGTIGANLPFFSPDGNWIAFFTNTHLKKISVSGGTPVSLCTVGKSRGGTWGKDETIVFAPSTVSGLQRIHSAGGETEELTVRVEGTERSHRWPRFMPDGRHVLFTSQAFGENFNDSNIEVLSLDTMQRSVLHQGGSCPQFAPGGFLIFVREATVYAARLNTDAWELRSAPVPIIEEVWSHALTGGAPIAFSSDGKMAYSHGTPMAANSLVMIARDGTVSPLIADLRTYASPRFAPDGKHIAMAMLRPDSTAMDIWVYDLARETLGRLTYSDADDERPVWSPDGERIAFVSLRNGIIPNMYVRNADGSGEVERFQVSKITQIPSGFTPEGNTIIYYAIGDPNGALWSLSLEEGAKPEPFLVTPFNEKHPALSPDGKWLAYTSNESGREEIYLRPFPKAAGKWQVSTSGGQHAMWSPDGTELFYEEDNDLMDVVIDLRAGAPMIGRPSTLFELPIGANETGRGYDISPDGQRFVAVKAELGGRDFGKSHLRFVFHWFNELETKIPKSKK